MRLPRALRGAWRLAAVALLAGVVALHFAEIDGLEAPIREGLERALRLKVDVDGPARLRLFPVPGFSADGVVIHSDPAFGLEPFAYVSSLELDLHLPALLTGRVVFSNLRLVEPSVNLTKNRDGDWNVTILLDRLFGVAGPGRLPLSRVEVRSGRLNFKFEDTKSVFYLSGADVDVGSDGGSKPGLSFRFEGEPSRTDRAAQGFGRFSGNGRLTFVEGAEDHLRLVVRLERSAIPDLLTLALGHGAGLSGFVASRAELEGPLSAVRIEGYLELADVDRRFLLPARHGKWLLDYGGSLNLPARTLELETRLEDSGRVPIAIRLGTSDYLSRPNWAVLVTADRLPLDTMPALGAELGFAVPDGLSTQGFVSGAVSWSPGDGPRGRLEVSDAVIRRAESQPVTLEQATIVFEAERYRLEPARFEVGPAVAVVGFSRCYDSRVSEIEIEARKLPVEAMLREWTRLFSDNVPPLFQLANSGEWTGRLLCSRGADGRETWSGTADIRDASVTIPGVVSPVRLQSLRGDSSGREIRFTGSVGATEFQGSMARRQSADWPLEVDLEFVELNAAELERLLAPTLSRPGGLLARTLRLRSAAPPAWLENRKVKGSFRAGRFTAGPLVLSEVTGRFFWQGTRCNVVVDSARGGAAALSGRVGLDLGEPSPRYQLTAKVTGLPWEGGLLDAEGRLRTSGSGPALIANATAEGEFSAVFPKPGDSGLDAVSGCYELGGALTLRLPCLRIHSGDAIRFGWGEIDATGRFELELFDDEGSYTAAGRLSPLRLSLAEPAP